MHRPFIKGKNQNKTNFFLTVVLFLSDVFLSIHKTKIRLAQRLFLNYLTEAIGMGGLINV